MSSERVAAAASTRPAIASTKTIEYVSASTRPADTARVEVKSERF
jgi:hypothetical protein